MTCRHPVRRDKHVWQGPPATACRCIHVLMCDMTCNKTLGHLAKLETVPTISGTPTTITLGSLAAPTDSCQAMVWAAWQHQQTTAKQWFVMGCSQEGRSDICTNGGYNLHVEVA